MLTLFLSVMAIQWVTTDRLPRTPELTLVDKVVNGTVCHILTVALCSIVINWLGEHRLLTAEQISVVEGVTLVRTLLLWAAILPVAVVPASSTPCFENSLAMVARAGRLRIHPGPRAFVPGGADLVEEQDTWRQTICGGSAVGA